jgi:hypothetical protein
LGESSFLLFCSVHAAFSVQTDAVMNNSGIMLAIREKHDKLPDNCINVKE